METIEPTTMEADRPVRGYCWVQVGNSNGLGQDGSDGGNEKCSHSVYILNEELTDFPCR